jgi:hypothetical protein
MRWSQAGMTVPTGVWRAGAVVRSHKPSAGMPSRYPESSRLSPSITYRPILGIPAARLVSGRRLEGLAIPGGAARGTGYPWGKRRARARHAGDAARPRHRQRAVSRICPRRQRRDFLARRRGEIRRCTRAAASPVRPRPRFRRCGRAAVSPVWSGRGFAGVVGRRFRRCGRVAVSPVWSGGGFAGAPMAAVAGARLRPCYG